MEDEGFVDDDFIEETAWEYFALHGEACLSTLRRLAEAAEASGDALAAQTWRAVREVAGWIVSNDETVWSNPADRGTP